MKHLKALLIVDMQNDFCPGGALGVPEGDKIITVINRYTNLFSRKGLPVFISRDLHPRKTRHFKKYGGVWPVHCVRNTKGAGLHPKLKLPERPIFLYKGMDPEKDSYSVFQAEDGDGINFLSLLRVLGIKEIYLGGLATDYCVKFTTLDALRKRFVVKVLFDAIKGVNIRPQDSSRAISLMLKKGARQADYKRIVRLLG
ncbi:MAG: isochorismatase family protein [Candidatus Omnitrophica bacterium]|nr:isochorismatase family protein [Candidatus Omnitrophota bacterium]